MLDTGWVDQHTKAGMAMSNMRDEGEVQHLSFNDRLHPVTVPELELPLRWIMLPRHYRRVFGAAQRAAICDERDSCDDWIMHWLKQTRREALRADYTLDEVNHWTMEGCLFGRIEAHAK